jgi:hypothetical protein
VGSSASCRRRLSPSATTTYHGRLGNRRRAHAGTRLRVEKTAGIVTLTLNRPQAMNALSRELRTALVDAFTVLARDPEADVAIVTGAGRAFCASLNLKDLSDQALGRRRDRGGDRRRRQLPLGRACRGVESFYQEAGLSRRTLYRMLAPSGNPTLENIARVVRAIAKSAA